MGMLPYDELVTHSCTACLVRNCNAVEYIADPDHLHSCLQENGRSVTSRHNRIAALLTRLAKSVGFHVEREPHFDARLQMSADADPSTGHRTLGVTQPGERGDLLLTRGDQQILIDVSVTRPTSTTYLSTNPLVTSKPLIAASIVEQRKHATYDMECRLQGWKFTPFVMETYGGFGREARTLLETIASSADEYGEYRSPQQFLTHAYTAFSVALQIGNADLSRSGATRHWVRTRREDGMGMIEVTVGEDTIFTADTTRPGSIEVDVDRQVRIRSSGNRPQTTSKA
jgi:hypothetical protein